MPRYFGRSVARSFASLATMGVVGVGALAGTQLVGTGAARAATVRSGAMALAGSAQTSSDTNNVTFNYDDATHYFTVPAGVTQVQITGTGGEGGLAEGHIGYYGGPAPGLGAQLSLTAPVNPGDVLVVMVGGEGAQGDADNGGGGGLSSGDTENGGAGGSPNLAEPCLTGGGGGGGTEIVDANSGAVLLDAAGGGGAGGGAAVGGGGQGGAGGNAGDLPTANGAWGTGLGAGPGGGYAASSMTAGTDGGTQGLASSAGCGGGGGGGLYQPDLGVTGGGGTGGTGGVDVGGGGGGGAGQSYWDPAGQDVQLSDAPGGDGNVQIGWANPTPDAFLSVSANPISATAPVTITATVTPAGGDAFGVPTGTVTFLDLTTGGTPLGLPVQLSDSIPDTASVETTLPAGTQQVVAVYDGDSNFAPVDSQVIDEVVNKLSTSTTIHPTSHTVAQGHKVTFKSTVTSGGAPVTTGSVSFTEGTTVLGTVALTAKGTASWSTTALALGSDRVVASYSGDAVHAASQSKAARVTVHPPAV